MNLDFSDFDETDEPIIFNVEDIDFELPDTEGVIAWINRVAEGEDKRIGAVSYIFCSDNYLIELNREFAFADWDFGYEPRTTNHVMPPAGLGRRLEAIFFWFSSFSFSFESEAC